MSVNMELLEQVMQHTTLGFLSDAKREKRRLAAELETYRAGR